VTKRGLPGLMHAPWVGPIFSKNRDEVSELEMLVIATPEFIGEVDPSVLPMYGPGQNTQQPLNKEFYGRGYVEVPRCDPPADHASYQNQHHTGVAPASYQVPLEVEQSPPLTQGNGSRPQGGAARAQQATQPFGAGPRR